MKPRRARPTEITPQCPDCTYVLTGLSTPRCPECGLKLDPRLLLEPALAVPRPAWERRRHLGFFAAAIRTFTGVCFRPGRFFAGLQYPDRLRQSIGWLVLLLFCMLLLLLAYVFAANHLAGMSPARLKVTWPAYIHWVVTDTGLHLAAGACVVVPSVLLPLLFADLILWRARSRYRLFFKTVCYGATVYAWLALGVCIAAPILSLWRRLAGVSLLDSPAPWSRWLVVALVTWYHALVFNVVLGTRFAALLPRRPTAHAILALLVLVVWAASLYLLLIDDLFGVRLAIARWERAFVR